jgi:hypothetical protein
MPTLWVPKISVGCRIRKPAAASKARATLTAAGTSDAECRLHGRAALGLASVTSLPSSLADTRVADSDKLPNTLDGAATFRAPQAGQATPPHGLVWKPRSPPSPTTRPRRPGKASTPR